MIRAENTESGAVAGTALGGRVTRRIDTAQRRTNTSAAAVRLSMVAKVMREVREWGLPALHSRQRASFYSRTDSGGD